MTLITSPTFMTELQQQHDRDNEQAGVLKQDIKALCLRAGTESPSLIEPLADICKKLDDEFVFWHEKSLASLPNPLRAQLTLKLDQFPRLRHNICRSKLLIIAGEQCTRELDALQQLLDDQNILIDEPIKSAVNALIVYLKTSDFSEQHKEAVSYTYSLLTDPDFISTTSKRRYYKDLNDFIDSFPGGSRVLNNFGNYFLAWTWFFMAEVFVIVMTRPFFEAMISSIASILPVLSPTFIVYALLVIPPALCVLLLFTSLQRTGMAKAMEPVVLLVHADNTVKKFNRSLEKFMTLNQITSTADSVKSEIILLKDKKLKNKQPIDTLIKLLDQLNTLSENGTEHSVREFMGQYNGLCSTLQQHVSFFMPSEQAQLDKEINNFLCQLLNSAPNRERTEEVGRLFAAMEM